MDDHEVQLLLDMSERYENISGEHFGKIIQFDTRNVMRPIGVFRASQHLLPVPVHTNLLCILSTIKIVQISGSRSSDESKLLSPYILRLIHFPSLSLFTKNAFWLCFVMHVGVQSIAPFGSRCRCFGRSKRAKRQNFSPAHFQFCAINIMRRRRHRD